MPWLSSLKRRVGAEGVAFAGKHAGRVFALALEGKGAGGVGVAAGHVVQHQPLQDFAMVFVLRQRHLADGGAARATWWSARCGFPCRGSSPRIRRPHRPFACRATGPAACGRPASWRLRAAVARSSTASDAVGLVGLVRRAACARGGAQLLDFARQPGLAARALFVAAHGVADFGQVAGARGRHHRRLVGAVAHVHRRQAAVARAAGPARPAAACSAWYSAVTPSSLKRAAMVPNTGICSARRGPGFLVALHLLGHVAQRVAARPCGRTC